VIQLDAVHISVAAAHRFHLHLSCWGDCFRRGGLRFGAGAQAASDTAANGQNGCHETLAHLVLGYLAAGKTAEDIVAEFPDITRDQIAACLDYARELTNLRPSSDGLAVLG
jgi:hypothetical protein